MNEERKRFIQKQAKKQEPQIATNEHGEVITGQITVHQHPDDKAKPKKSSDPQFFNLMTEFQTNIFQYYDLTETEAGLVLQLCTYARFTTDYVDKNYIMYNRKPATNKDIAKILKISYYQFVQNYKKKLLATEVLLEDDNGMYLNNDVMNRGYLLDHHKSYRVFKKPVQELYDLFVQEGKPATAKHVGLFFSLIPFIYKQDNTLVMKEYNEELKRFVYHDYDSLAEALGKRNQKLKNRNYGTFQESIMKMNDVYFEASGTHLIYEVEIAVRPASIKDSKKRKEFRLVINPNVSFSSTPKVKKSLEKILLDIDLSNDFSSNKDNEENI
ncbi:hypothetical protein [Macrococcus carouselicus]|uniref:Uncharacterized protein n=1 Tax=Macrococcus carouselicus TaxID=69969 RepID=A0A9Q8CJ02_9STAP|nr:hypothetical protein [Macrococcus carouselicus]TDL94261.1 hypothetical protein ERX40_11025 [Macrococcus carouselicus]